MLEKKKLMLDTNKEMKLQKLIFFFTQLWMGLWLSLAPLYASAEIQYEPFASPERHELSFNLSFKSLELKAISSTSLQYTFYITELDQLLPEKFRKIFALGLQGGLKRFKSKKDGGKQGICESEDISPLVWRAGLKAKISYSVVQPFAEFGFAGSYCKQKKVKKKFRSQFTYGLSLSLKALDLSSIYSLDQDYGINDVGVIGSCLNYQVSNSNKSLKACQIGLQISF